jgi:hypothetical protein
VSWPQVVMAVLMLVGATFSVVRTVRNREISSTVATLTILLLLAWESGFALLLHAGGFW